MSKQMMIFFGLLAGAAFFVGFTGGLSESNGAPIAFFTILALVSAAAIPLIEDEQSRYRRQKAVARVNNRHTSA
ncbi:MAG: hypothetical protein AAFX02_02880 [Pseudomonadota bacterium]